MSIATTVLDAAEVSIVSIHADQSRPGKYRHTELKFEMFQSYQFMQINPDIR